MNQLEFDFKPEVTARAFEVATARSLAINIVNTYDITFEEELRMITMDYIGRPVSTETRYQIEAEMNRLFIQYDYYNMNFEIELNERQIIMIPLDNLTRSVFRGFRSGDERTT